MIPALRRLWWATLPYYGWTGSAGEEGATPCPWWAHPLAWLHRLADSCLGGRDVFGPRFNAGLRGRPWR